MGEQVLIRWSQPTINGVPVGPRWYASLATPFASLEFAGLFLEAEAGWRLELWTPGRRMAGGNYPCLATPRKHVQRWASCHWRVLARRGGMDPRSKPPRGGPCPEKQHLVRFLAELARC